MKLAKLLLFLFLTMSMHNSVLAADIVSIVNPIRGNDFWQNSKTITEVPNFQSQLISALNLPATWLVRFDALIDPSIQDFLRKIDSSNEVGLFLEVTPTLAEKVGVTYNRSENWHFPRSVFLVGYSPGDRVKMIDVIFEEYKQIFGSYPTSVGAWWIDAFSLNYMRNKYKIEANLAVADQYSTDSYQVWGLFWSTPFYPSKNNALMPAGSVSEKIGVVTTQWAPRDPILGYGNGVLDSTYSVQPNDYILRGLDIEYFKKLLSIYSFVTIGLENDFTDPQILDEYKRQIEHLSKLTQENQLRPMTMTEYARFYKSQNPTISPASLVFSKDLLGGERKAVWFQSPVYRVGWFYNDQGSVIRDLRLYNDSIKEDCYEQACQTLNLAVGAISAIDEITFGSKLVIDRGRITDFSLQKTKEGAEISYFNQSGTLRNIKFLNNDIEINGRIAPIAVWILEAKQQKEQEIIEESRIDTSLDLSQFQKLGTAFLKFGLFVFLFLIIPGLLLSRRLLLAIPVGVIIFTLCSFIFGFIDYQILWVLPVLSFIGLFYRRPTIKLKIDLRQIIALLVILVGSSLWMVTQFKNGLVYGYGLGFWGPNGHDGIWHIALIEQLKQGLPVINPIYSGTILQNYHYFYDLLPATTSYLFEINSLDLLFRFYPLVIAIMIGFLSYSFAYRQFSSYKAALLSLFFVYFGGSFGWVVSFFRDGSFGGESLFWSQQSVSTLLNPPYAISLMLFIAGLLVYQNIYKYKSDNVLNKCLLILLWGSLIAFKVYGGLLIIGALFMVMIEKAVRQKDFSVIPVFFGVLVLSLCVFLPNNSFSHSLIAFNPFWLVDSMIQAEDRLNWYRVAIMIQTNEPLKLIFAYSIGTLIYLVGNLGTRLLFIGSIKQLWSDRLLFYVVFAGILIPLLFIQIGNNWNIIQFFYYSLFIINFYAALSLAKIWSRLGFFKGGLLVLVILLITIPTTLNTLSQYAPSRPSSMLPLSEYKALKFLASQEYGTVMTLPYDFFTKTAFQAPYPLSVYTSTSYVSAFSQKPTFLEDHVNLEILGIDYDGRINQIRDVLSNPTISTKILKENKIDYLYILKNRNHLKIDLQADKIFENELVDIYRLW